MHGGRGSQRHRHEHCRRVRGSMSAQPTDCSPSAGFKIPAQEAANATQQVPRGLALRNITASNQRRTTPKVWDQVLKAVDGPFQGFGGPAGEGRFA